jgi:SAM-dependent methyltransferase
MEDTARGAAVPGPAERQRDHWDRAFAARPQRYGREASAPARATAPLLKAMGAATLLELGAGQGRDTLFFARQGLRVSALDYAPSAVTALDAAAREAGLGGAIAALAHDAREPLPFADGAFDACYSHMLFCMALTTPELERLTAEVRRVVRPGGLVVYTARTTSDPDFGLGTDHGDNLYEDEGFVVHFFDRPLVERLARGFELVEVAEFEEGDLPRRLFRVTMRRV